jgi:uncharacterized protein YlaI
MSAIDISSIVALVKQGRTVISGEDSMIVDAVLRATEEKRIATFYVKRALKDEIMRRYWTPERVKESAIKPVSEEETKRIKAELSIDVNGYSNRIDCPRCGHGYGMYEFLKQGIEEHGREIVEAVFSLKDIAVIRVNPVHTPVCPKCNLRITIVGDARINGHWYEHAQYGCCMKNAV